MQEIITDAKTGEVTVRDYTPEAVPLADAQAAQIAGLRASCAAAIVGGFTSSALGAAHTYPSGDTDQTNLIGATIAAGLAPAGWTVNFWCADSTGTWTFAPHTAAQIQQVFGDGVIVRVAMSAKLATLSAQVMAVTDTTTKGIAAVQAVVW